MSTSYYSILTALLAGVFVATVTPVSLPVLMWVSFVTVILLVLSLRVQTTKREQGILLSLVVVISFTIGMTRMELAKSNFGHSPLQTLVGEQVTITGGVVRDPEMRAKSLHLYIETESADVLLVTADRYTSVAYGDVVEVTGTLKAPESFVSDTGRLFDYPSYLKARGVEYQVAFATVTVAASGHGNIVLAKLYTLKHMLQDSINAYLPEPASALGQGLLLGVGEALGEEIETAFRQAGLIHIVVLSGYNIMLIVTFMMLFLRPLRTGPVKLMLSLLAIAAFALMVGLSATVWRASLMAAILVIATAYHRQYLVLRILLLTAVVMVFINPWLLVYDIGFQLSFMATFGLVLIAPQLERIFSWVPELYGLRTFFFATIATQLAVLPILIYQIGEVSLISVVANVLVLPFIPVAMLLTFLMALFGLIIPSLTSLIAWPAAMVLIGIIKATVWFAALPYSAVAVPVVPVLIIPLFYIGLGLWLLWCYRRHPVAFNLGDLGATEVVQTVSGVTIQKTNK